MDNGMRFDESILRNDEKAVFALRSLYNKKGYSRYKMSKFEEYDFYSENKDFLVSDGIITFTDTTGKLMALKPDVTLSILKNFRDEPGVIEKVYYNENVYRISETSHTYKEIMQTGLECMGDIGEKEIYEVVSLALDSLKIIIDDFVLDISHACIIPDILNDHGIASYRQEEVAKAIAEKNGDRLRELLTDEEFDVVKTFIKKFTDTSSVLESLKNIALSEDSKKDVEDLERILRYTDEQGYGDNVRIDFSIWDTGSYYSGIVFKGYLKGIASKVISGGRYDKLMQKMGRTGGAIGFAVYLDVLERLDDTAKPDDGYINIALPKGRLGNNVYDMFEKAGFYCPGIREDNRKLVFENDELKLRYFWVKPTDVPIYVERGAADIGVAGKDVVLENSPDVYELLDLKTGVCEICVAALKGFKDDTSRTLRVATKFTDIAREFYADKCRDIDIIKLNGSIELAPILGLSDVIVDIVETGTTLRENDLETVEKVMPISARLIANKASFEFKGKRIEGIKKALLKEMEDEK